MFLPSCQLTAALVSVLALVYGSEDVAHATCSRDLHDIQETELNDRQETQFLQAGVYVHPSTPPQSTPVDASAAEHPAGEQRHPEAAAAAAAAALRASAGKHVSLSLAEVHSSEAPTWAWIYVAVCLAIGPVCMLLVSTFASTGKKQSTGQRPGDAGQTRIAYFDLWRCLCVAVMVISHAGEEFDDYVEWNMLGGQQWILPCIMLISGTCYVKSSLPLVHYIARLLAYFSFGNFLNWVAAVITGTHWWIEITTRGVTFQMFFVLGLGGSAFLTAPLKLMLKSNNKRPSFISVQSGIYGCMFLAFFVCYWFGNLDGSSSELQMMRVLAESSVTLMLATLALDFMPPQQQDLTGWVLLMWIYATRSLRAEPRPGHEIHLHDLFVFAVFVQQNPLRGSKPLGTLLAQSWPILLLVGGFMLHPGLKQRLDLEPPATINARMRHYSVEALCVVAFTTIPTAGPERTIQLPNCIRRDMSWANNWALFAYCSHYAIYRLLLGNTWNGGESTNAGVCIVFGALLLFYALEHSSRSPHVSAPEDSPAKVPN